MDILVLAFGICVLLLLSGFFSASETAMMSLSRTEIRRMAEGGRSGRTVSMLLERPQRLLSTIILGNMFVNVLLASLFAALLNRIFMTGGDGGGFFEKTALVLLPDIDINTAKTAGAVCRSVLNIVIVTPLLMIFGEQTPKVAAYSKGPEIARFSAIPLSWLCILLGPLNWLLRTAGDFCLLLLGQSSGGNRDSMTADELRSSISVSKETGITNKNEQVILERIVELGSIDVKEVMTHRMDLIGMRDSLTLREAYDLARSKRHSWYPVFHENMDDIWGVLTLVDFPLWRNAPEMERTLESFKNDLASISRGPVYKPKFVPATVHIDKLLHVMRQEARSFAVVADEYGGTAGIVTLNDLIEEILGRFASSDEDVDAVNFRKDGVAVADGRAHLRALQKQFGDVFDDEELESDTLGGLIMEKLGKIPRKGEVVELDENTVLRVRRMAGRRVSTVEIVRSAAEAES